MRRAKDTGTLLAPVGVAVLAIACCAGLPVVAGVLGALSLAAILGVGGGLIALMAIIASVVLILRARGRRSCPPTAGRPSP